MMNVYHWRNTARPVRFFSVDARASFPILLFVMHMRLWTLIFAVVVILVFFILERMGLNLPVAMRRLRLFFTGDKRPAVVKAHQRGFIDRGGKY